MRHFQESLRYLKDCGEIGPRFLLQGWLYSYGFFIFFATDPGITREPYDLLSDDVPKIVRQMIAILGIVGLGHQ